MVKFGVILKDLSASWLSYLVLKQINTIIEEKTNDDFVIFFENVAPMCMAPKCATMSVNEIWNFEGTLVSTDFSTHEMLNAVINNKCNKIFYIWDLEWLRNKKNFIENISILRNPDVEIVVRNKIHSKAFRNYANREPDHVISNFNILELMEL